MADIAPAQGATGSSSATALTAPGGALGKDDFLKLLVTQLQNQDPLSPTDNTQFVAQLAQFSALEQMSNVSSAMQSLTSTSQLAQGAALAGRTVTYQLGDADAVTGVVGKVTLKDGAVSLEIDGKSVPLSAIQEILPPGSGS